MLQLLVTFANCTNGEVRLMGGSTQNEGKVEVCVNQAWGSLQTTWISRIWLDLIYCLFFIQYTLKGSKPKYLSVYGQGSIPIILAELACTVSENSLLDCRNSDYGLLNSHKYEVAGVDCESKFSLFSCNCNYYFIT